MGMMVFYYKGIELGAYSVRGTNHRDLVHTLFELADDYNVPRNEIKVKIEERGGCYEKCRD